MRVHAWRSGIHLWIIELIYGSTLVRVPESTLWVLLAQILWHKLRSLALRDKLASRALRILGYWAAEVRNLQGL